MEHGAWRELFGTLRGDRKTRRLDESNPYDESSPGVKD
jgi:hypothetical protein